MTKTRKGNRNVGRDFGFPSPVIAVTFGGMQQGWSDWSFAVEPARVMLPSTFRLPFDHA
jgi:hypothetical protein